MLKLLLLWLLLSLFTKTVADDNAEATTDDSENDKVSSGICVDVRSNTVALYPANIMSAAIHTLMVYCLFVCLLVCLFVYVRVQWCTNLHQPVRVLRAFCQFFVDAEYDRPKPNGSIGYRYLTARQHEFERTYFKISTVPNPWKHALKRTMKTVFVIKNIYSTSRYTTTPRRVLIAWGPVFNKDPGHEDAIEFILFAKRKKEKFWIVPADDCYAKNVNDFNATFATTKHMSTRKTS